MSDIIVDRLPPVVAVREPAEQRDREPGRRPGRPPRPVSRKPEAEDDLESDAPPHQIDDMA